MGLFRWMREAQRRLWWTLQLPLHSFFSLGSRTGPPVTLWLWCEAHMHTKCMRAHTHTHVQVGKRMSSLSSLEGLEDDELIHPVDKLWSEVLSDLQRRQRWWSWLTISGCIDQWVHRNDLEV